MEKELEITEQDIEHLRGVMKALKGRLTQEERIAIAVDLGIAFRKGHDLGYKRGFNVGSRKVQKAVNARRVASKDECTAEDVVAEDSAFRLEGLVERAVNKALGDKLSPIEQLLMKATA